MLKLALQQRKRAVLYRESDFLRLCNALMARIREAAAQ